MCVLRYYVTMAQEGNISRAAEILHITQPTLSRQLMDLEKELETTLFHRGKKEITLTDDGLLLYQRAQEILELSERTRQDFVGRTDSISGVISIGCGGGMAMRVLAGLIRDFSHRYPDVQLDLYNGYSDDIKTRLDKGLLDVGLLMEPVEISKYDFIRLSQSERWGVLAPADAVFRETEGGLPLSQVTKYPLLLPKRASTQNEILNWFGKDRAKIRVFATYNLLSNAVLLVEQGLGCAICLDGALSVHGDPSTQFLPITPERMTHSVLVWKKDRIFGMSCLFMTPDTSRVQGLFYARGARGRGAKIDIVCIMENLFFKMQYILDIKEDISYTVSTKRGERMKNKKLKLARVEKDLSQAELAEKVGVTRQTIGLIEAGGYNPTLNLCIAICKALDKTLDQVFWEEN